MLLVDGRSLTLEAIVSVAQGTRDAALAPDARQRIERSRAVVDAKSAGPDAVYGINTGFGSFSEVRIDAEALDALQINLLRSHAAGVGPPLGEPSVRAMMLLRANVLARGHSGIRAATVDALLALLNARVHPVVPSRGSVGASGDLAPLAHLSLVLVGEGEASTPKGHLRGKDALRLAGLDPVRLGPKEGLALINGTQASVAVLALALDQALRLVRAADVVAALSIDALRGSSRPFEARIHEARPHPGQAVSAANIARLLEGSAINASHANCGRVQDAYSQRCAAQVHGAVRDALGFVRSVVDVEANSSTDNPMVFAETGEIVSGGNFHGAPLGIAADLLAIAAAQLATISERRADRLVNPALSGLPPFLTERGGIESGLMIAQVTAAALASEMKTLAHPASVDTIPTSGSKEDHVSMSMTAALKAERTLALAKNVIAIELLCAARAIDLLAPLTTSAPLVRVHRAVRAVAPARDGDHPPSPDIAAIARLIEAGELDHASGVDVNL
jgi:histidine ammonia-lyase